MLAHNGAPRPASSVFTKIRGPLKSAKRRCNVLFCCDWVVEKLGIDDGGAKRIQLLIFVTAIVAAIVATFTRALVVGFEESVGLKRDEHGEFLLGYWPPLVAGASPVLLFLLSCVVGVLQLRKQDPKVVRSCCLWSQCFIGVMMVAMGVLGPLAEFQDLKIQYEKDCPKSERFGELEGLWQEMDSFYTKCSAERNVPISRCPGFASHFERRIETVEYLQDLEEDFACSGMCDPKGRPLFDVGATAEDASCASELVKYAGRVADTVLPTVIMGFLLVITGAVLYYYPNL